VYITLKFLHVLLAIIAVGFTSSFGLIAARGATGGPDGREMKFALGTIRTMSLVAHICYFLLLVTGFGLIHVAGYPWYAWLKWSVALFAVAFLAGQFVMLPSVKKRLAMLETKGPSDPAFIAASKQSAMLGAVLGVMTLVILWLMVSKPM
jgi:uncharacterized membrane protein